VYWVWRRELAVTLRAPIVYVIGGLFLVVQGIAFAGLVTALSDPRRPAPLGALLEGQLAGTLLTWVLQLVVLTLLGMRTIAEERRGGGWELLLTAQVSERAAVIGKWLAATTVYALLWIPTLAYLGVVAAFRGDGGSWDLASIACGYAGAIAIGAALLAWAVAASAATSTTLAAGGLGFALLVAWFLIGELPALSPDLAMDHPTLAAVLSTIGLRTRLTAFARGEIDLAAVLVIATIAVTGLSLAVVLACAGRRRMKELRERVLATANLAAIGALAIVLAVRHPHAWDVSARHASSLDPATTAVLAELPAPATLTIIEPTYGALEPLYDEVARVAERMRRAGEITVHRIDPAALPGGLDAAARAAGLQPKDLASNGGVVVELGGRRRVVDVFELATIEAGVQGAPTFEHLAIEQALAGTLAELATTVPVTACATTGHGELSLETSDPKGADWTAVGNRLRADGITTTEVAAGATAAPTLFAHCSVVIVAGPIRELSAEEALAIQRFVAGGGGLLVAAAGRPVPNGPELAATGLEGVLAADGLGLPFAIAIDPTLAIRELPGALMIASGYSAHPINTGFADRRRTLWFQPRAVTITRGAQALISASPASWGEVDFHAAPAKDERDLAGPVVLAAASAVHSGHRVVAIGSAESFTAAALSGGASAGDLWLEHVVRWLANKPAPSLAIAARTPDQVRLVMTAGERREVIALSVAGIPLAWLVLGGALVWWRRRRAGRAA
jgi:ABC-2 type transport system permease protein